MSLKRLIIVGTMVTSALVVVVGPASAASAAGAAAPRGVSAEAQAASIREATKAGDLSLIKDGPELSKAEVVSLGQRMAATATTMATRQAEVAAGLVSPTASIGLGWYVYLRFSPQDQRFILGAGSIAVTGLICLISGGTACIVAGWVAGTIALYVSIYYNPRCWVEFAFSYSGRLARFNRSWRC